MAGQSMQLAKEALQVPQCHFEELPLKTFVLKVFLHSLPASCFFNIVIFGSSFQSLFPQVCRQNHLHVMFIIQCKKASLIMDNPLVDNDEKCYRVAPTQTTVCQKPSLQ